jgi:hypothetical protein
MPLSPSDRHEIPISASEAVTVVARADHDSGLVAYTVAGPAAGGTFIIEPLFGPDEFAPPTARSVTVHCGRIEGRMLWRPNHRPDLPYLDAVPIAGSPTLSIRHARRDQPGSDLYLWRATDKPFPDNLPNPVAAKAERLITALVRCWADRPDLRALQTAAARRQAPWFIDRQAHLIADLRGKAAALAEDIRDREAAIERALDYYEDGNMPPIPPPTPPHP